LAIIEFLVMNDALRKMVMEHKESGLIQEEAVKGGMLSIYQDGLAKAKALDSASKASAKFTPPLTRSSTFLIKSAKKTNL
jgi:phage-related minor tail protein